MATDEGMFKALLRFWRNRRGMSQLDLGLAANVSARHISFLETGRSQPSVEMVLTLTETLDVPLRDRNEILRAAGFDPRYPEPNVMDVLAGQVGLAVDSLLVNHEPFPTIVFDLGYDILRMNKAATSLLALVGFGDRRDQNLLRLLFDPALRPIFPDWEGLAAEVLRRAQRELITRPNDRRLTDLLDELLNMPGVPVDWRVPDLAGSSDPTVSMRLSLGDLELSVLGMITTFSAPNNVTLDELQIESWVPLDEQTQRYFEDAAALG